MTRFVSEALAKHERAAFLSGDDRVYLYIRETVSQDVKRKYAACYDLIERSTGKVAGFYTLSVHGIPLNDVAPELAKKLPRYPRAPVVLIVRCSAATGSPAPAGAGSRPRCPEASAAALRRKR